MSQLEKKKGSSLLRSSLAAADIKSAQVDQERNEKNIEKQKKIHVRLLKF